MNPIETLFVVLLVCLVKLAFLAAGCWMMYCGWFGCGITTIVLGVLFIGASCSTNKEIHDYDETEDDE